MKEKKVILWEGKLMVRGLGVWEGCFEEEESKLKEKSNFLVLFFFYCGLGKRLWWLG